MLPISVPMADIGDEGVQQQQEQQQQGRTEAPC
jgi:hypothetical protein